MLNCTILLTTKATKDKDGGAGDVERMEGCEMTVTVMKKADLGWNSWGREIPNDTIGKFEKRWEGLLSRQPSRPQSRRSV